MLARGVKFIAGRYSCARLQRLHLSSALAASKKSFFIVSSPARGYQVRLSTVCPDLPDIALGDLAAYIHHEINGTYVDIHKHLSDLIDLLEIPNEGTVTKVALDDAKLLVEEVGACPENLESFVSNRDLVDRSITIMEEPEYIFEDPVSLYDLCEYDEYQTADQLIKLAVLRGARVVRVVRGLHSTQIETANGVKVSIPSDKKTNIADRIRNFVLQHFWEGGIRAQAEDSQIHRWCNVCKNHKLPGEISSCRSGVPQCLNYLSER